MGTRTMGQVDHFEKARAPWWCLATLMLLPACTAVEPISPQLGVTQGRVEVRFETPIDLVGRRADGAPVVRRRVRHVVARPLAVRGDSLVLEVMRSVSADHWGRESRPFVAAIPTTDSSIVVGARRASRGRTGALILGVPFVAWLLFGLVYGSGGT
ncbi:MAG TPA: hypothetical protein VG106_03230 [Vicinamibacterales bacterium]|nr:hypothetical protein [Vicinamibacterales bacterium]